jgi:hypothetical protein
MNDVQTELERLREEVAELKRALGERQQLAAPNLPALRDNLEFVTNCARFAEGNFSEAAMRRKYHLEEETWTALGKDEALIERVELEKVRRVRDGSCKRERAQELITKGPSILDSIATSPKASDKHKIDALKVLDSFADPGAQAARDDSDRVVVTINLGGDQKLVFDKSVKPNPNDDDKIIDVTPPVPGFDL